MKLGINTENTRISHSRIFHETVKLEINKAKLIVKLFMLLNHKSMSERIAFIKDHIPCPLFGRYSSTEGGITYYTLLARLGLPGRETK